MGAELKGLISLFILNLSLTSIISGFIGGPAIVYLAPRQSVSKIFIANITWIIVTITIVTYSLLYFDLLSSVEPVRFYRMAFLECLIVTLFMVLLGKERIKTHNIMQVTKVAIAVIGLLLFIQFGTKNFIAFLDSYEISLIITAFTSLILTAQYYRPNRMSTWAETLKSGFKLGSVVQVGNLAQLLNYRIGYYVLEIVISPIEVALVRIGIFSASLQIAEALWQFTRSVNTVQYSRISNISDRSEALQLSLKLVRLNYAVTSLGIIVLLLFPSSFYASIFGTEFFEIKDHFLIISPGILALAFGGGINHYFAGLGEHRFNTISTIIGLVITVAIVFPLCKLFGTYGAALTASIVYCVQAISQLYFLRQRDGISASSFLLTSQDWLEARNLLRKLLNRS